MKISEKIYKLRTDLGLSQKDFAEQVGTSQSAINYWENGKREPRTNQLKKIATKYNIPLYILTDDSFDMWDINDPLNKNKARFVGDTNMLTPPRFTAPMSDDTTEQLTASDTSDDLKYLRSLLPNVSPNFRERFATSILALNEEQLETLLKIATALADDSDNTTN